MTNAALRGKPDAGNPHVRFDEGEVAPAATPRRGSLLYKIIVKVKPGMTPKEVVMDVDYKPNKDDSVDVSNFGMSIVKALQDFKPVKES